MQLRVHNMGKSDRDFETGVAGSPDGEWSGDQVSRWCATSVKEVGRVIQGAKARKNVKGRESTR
jgi:hypothetical protein